MAGIEAQDVPRSRRSLLVAAAGGAAALAVGALKPDRVDAVSVPMLTEVDNATTLPTGVTNATAGSQAFYGHAAGAGMGLEGTSVIGNGVNGVSTDTSDPENNLSNAGVVGVAGEVADTAVNKSLTGVYGYSDTTAVEGFAGAGVWGDSPDIGIIGTGSIGAFGDGGLGVLGLTRATDGIGVLATADEPTALALRAEGRVEFTRSGRTTIAGGKSKKTITLAGCTTSTIIFAVLATNRSGRYVRAAVPAAGSFTVYLNTTVANNSVVAWIAFTNPVNHSG